MASLHSACGCDAVHSEVGSCPERWSRRGLLRTGAALTAGVMTGLGAEIALPKTARAQAAMNPDAALQVMMDGNRRFVQIARLPARPTSVSAPPKITEAGR